jgi:putative Mg2+ transporter-C (MgtC) family protein
MYPLSLTDLLLRLATAMVCGAVIGLNRDLRNKPAGLRTFGLVGLGSAIVTLTIVQMASGAPDATSRVIQGVVTGIGFLGAGLILHRETPTRQVAGLTTAAAVWLTAGLGVAAGAGQLAIAWLSLLLTMIVLVTGRPIERVLARWLRRHRSTNGEHGNKDAKPDHSE